MEQRVEKEFGRVVQGLSDQERKGRLDIKYRTAAGKHIIVELKRYSPSYKITPAKLYEQVDKYTEALKKCLIANGEANPFIESIVVLGEVFDSSAYQKAKNILNTIGGRIIYYDTLINESLKSYSNFLSRQKEVGALRKLIDEL